MAWPRKEDHEIHYKQLVCNFHVSSNAALALKIWVLASSLDARGVGRTWSRGFVGSEP